MTGLLRLAFITLLAAAALGACSHPPRTRVLPVAMIEPSGGPGYGPGGPAGYGQTPVFIDHPPPPALCQCPPPPPVPGAVWIDGYWRWTGTAFLWQEGFWETRPPQGRRWWPAQWVCSDRAWYFRPGRWE